MVSPSLPKVLIVDDEKDNLEALGRLLRRDFQVVLAPSGEQGVVCLDQQGPFDVIVSDQRMPGMQGSDFLEKAQGLDPLATRILLTGFADLEAVVEAVNRGEIWHYIAKPWEPADLLHTLKQAAERSRTSRALETSLHSLSQAHAGLRAKDWARERLLLLLLHEFRTAPQVVENLKALNSDAGAIGVREKFLNNLLARFKVLEQDISDLLNEEKTLATLEKNTCNLVGLLKGLAKSKNGEFISPSSEGALEYITHEETLREILSLFIEMLASNVQKAPVFLKIESIKNPEPEFRISISLKSSGGPLMPSTWQGKNIDPTAAWNSLLEPFVGHEDLLQHSLGLRTQAARAVRRLSNLGGHAEFIFAKNHQDIELRVSLQGSL